jgi:hypothetical protein
MRVSHSHPEVWLGHQDMDWMICKMGDERMKKNKKDKKENIISIGYNWIVFGLIIGLSIIAFVSIGLAGEHQVTVCCEKTNDGFFCQDVPANECASGAQQVPTGCESTSFCRGGWCFDSSEGTCLDNTPQNVCNNNGGTWEKEFPPQCGLGCCILGDQAAFVTLTRCKALSRDLGLQTNYNTEIQNEVQCILSAQSQDKGACVFDFEFERTCSFGTKAECDTTEGEFFKDILCSAEDLATNCGPSKETTCVDGRDEVYFVDTCGNPANIYDASKIDDKEYWANLKSVAESCNPGEGNIDSKSCGNCNYLEGSVCRKADRGSKPTYGDNICVNLNCPEGTKHGESWCVTDSGAGGDNGQEPVGSRYYRHICNNNEVQSEPCADFRQEVCIEDSIDGFKQAACRVNRWQDCNAQITQIDCENTDRRDCLWRADFNFTHQQDAPLPPGAERGLCIPKNPVGLKFWEGEEALTVCAQGNDNCVAVFQKKKDFFSSGDWECVGNCHCLTDEWVEQHKDMCVSFGDCGPNVNWVGAEGFREGYNVSRQRYVPGQDIDLFQATPDGRPATGTGSVGSLNPGTTPDNSGNNAGGNIDDSV